jgi:hypothetical protein
MTHKIPFDLEKARNGAKIVTRDDWEVKDWHYFESSTNVSARIYYVYKNGSMVATTKDGKYHLLDIESTYDLFIEEEIPEPDIMWWNVYDMFGKFYIGGGVYKTKEDAIIEGRKGLGYMGCFPIDLSKLEK